MATLHEQVSEPEFRARLALLCLKGGGAGLPRGRRDRQIVLKSAVLLFDRQSTYGETEVNARLVEWKVTVGTALSVDHVSLRRELVDAGYLVRDPAGKSYRVSDPTRGAVSFAPDVDRVNPRAAVAAAAAERARRKIARGRPGGG